MELVIQFFVPSGSKYFILSSTRAFQPKPLIESYPDEKSGQAVKLSLHTALADRFNQ